MMMLLFLAMKPYQESSETSGGAFAGILGNRSVLNSMGLVSQWCLEGKGFVEGGGRVIVRTDDGWKDGPPVK